MAETATLEAHVVVAHGPRPVSPGVPRKRHVAAIPVVPAPKCATLPRLTESRLTESRSTESRLTESRLTESRSTESRLTESRSIDSDKTVPTIAVILPNSETNDTPKNSETDEKRESKAKSEPGDRSDGEQDGKQDSAPIVKAKSEPESRTDRGTQQQQVAPIKQNQILGQGNEAVVYSPPRLRKKKGVAGLFSSKPRSDIAIKRSKKKEYFVRLKDEYEMLSKFDHPNIVKVYELNEVAMEYSMERYSDADLFDVINDSDGLSDQMTHKYGRQLILAVQYIHRMGYAHRDIKAENILVKFGNCKHSGKSPKKRIYCPETRIVLGDFGFAVVASDEPVARIWGSPGYVDPSAMVPYCGRFYHKPNDVYAMGITIFAMRTSFAPWPERMKDGSEVGLPVNNTGHPLSRPGNPLYNTRLMYNALKKRAKTEAVGPEDIEKVVKYLADEIDNPRLKLSKSFCNFIARLVFPAHTQRYTVDEAAENMWKPAMSPPTRRHRH